MGHLGGGGTEQKEHAWALGPLKPCMNSTSLMWGPTELWGGLRGEKGGKGALLEGGQSGRASAWAQNF
jgi:hypothetical protein